MRIIVAGGSGLIGKAFTSSLQADGHQVWVLSRSPQKVRLPEGVKAAFWDGRTAEGWSDLLESADAVVNLAGENLAAGLWTAKRKRRILNSRTQSGRAIVSAIQQARHKPAILLQASAVGYYGPLGDEVVTEQSKSGSDFLSSICLDWEASTSPVETMGVRRVIIRTGLVLSTQGGALKPLLLPFRFFAGGPLGSGRQWWSWIAMEDQIGAMKFLLEKEDARGVFNLTAPNPVTMTEFGRVLAGVLKRPYWMPVPGFILRLLLGEMSTVILDGQRAIPEKLLSLGYSFHYSQLHDALEAIL